MHYVAIRTSTYIEEIKALESYFCAVIEAAEAGLVILQLLFYNYYSTIIILQLLFHNYYSTTIILQLLFYNYYSTIIILQLLWSYL